MKKRWLAIALSAVMAIHVLAPATVQAANSGDVLEGETGIEDSIFGDDEQDTPTEPEQQEKPVTPVTPKASKIIFVSTKKTVDYTGKLVKLSTKDVKVVTGNGKITFTYYTDKACKTLTYKGTSKKGTAPVNPGKYYVKAKVSATETFKADTTDNAFVLTIRPLRVKSMKVANTTTGIKLSWTKNAKATGYAIYRKVNGSAKEYTLLKRIGKNTTLSYIDKSAKQGTAYRYTICAYVKATDDTYVNGLKLSTGKNGCYLAPVSISSLAGVKKAVTVKWKRNTNAKGYQIIYSSNKDFKTYKTLTVKDVKSAKIQKLTSGKRYYFKVRAYKTIGNVKYYSVWSSVKSVKSK